MKPDRAIFVPPVAASSREELARGRARAFTRWTGAGVTGVIYYVSAGLEPRLNEMIVSYPDDGSARTTWEQIYRPMGTIVPRKVSDEPPRPSTR